jgi:hypothetical protein
MDNSSDQPSSDAGAPQAPLSAPAQVRARGLRLPSSRASAVLAATMLAVGVGVGAAIGPTPETSLAGSSGIVQKLPALIASLAAERRPAAATQPTTKAVQPPAVTPQATPATVTPTPAVTPAATSPSSSTQSESAPSSPAPAKKTGTTTLPPITSVWLIELSGVSFAEALATPAAAPYITGQLIPKGTLLSGWSALSASAFAGDAALAEHSSAVGAPPPLLHSIVQPPCPEGPTGAACAAGTPGALTAADEFLKATLATVTATTTYSEHGLVVVAFATVGVATSSELPAGASTATLTSSPPGGVVLLSPFAKAGAKSSIEFDPISPKKSLEKLLHRP